MEEECQVYHDHNKETLVIDFVVSIIVVQLDA